MQILASDSPLQATATRPSHGLCTMGQPPVVQQTAYAAYGGAEVDALNTGHLAAAVSISPITGKARKQLILALLEDPGVRLAARHAELLLRWRMMAIEPALHSVPALQPSAQPLQPHLLRAALAEDAMASTPVLLLSEQLLQLLSSPQPMPAEPNNSGQPAWERAMLQLDLQRLSTALCMPPPTGGASSNSASPKPGMHSVSSENPLPSFLYEYESPTTSCSAAAKQARAGGSLDAVTAPSPPPAPATTSPAPGSDSASLARTSTGMLAERPASDAALSSPAPPPPPAGPPRLHRISAPAAPASSAGSQPDATSGGLFSPSSAHPSAAAQMVPGVPEEVASCWGMPTDTLSDQHAGLARIGSLRQQPHPARLSKQQSGPCTVAPERRPSSGLGASWVSTSPASHGYTRQASSGVMGLSPHSTGVMGTSPDHGSGSLLMHPLGSRMSENWNAGGEASSLPTVGSLTAGGYLHSGSYQRQGSLLLPGLSSQLSGLHSNTATSPSAQQQLGAQPKEEPAMAGRPPAPRRGNSRQLPGSIASDENDNDVESPGGMDLETALEAIINYESATTEGGVSAATAAAAQHALQQHVAAAVRAASAGMPSGQQLAGPTSTASSQPASAPSTHQGVTGGDAGGAPMGLGTSFAVARMASSDLAGGGGAPAGFGVGSAPSATAYLHQHSLVSQQQYGGTGGLLSRMGSSLGHQDSNAAMADAMGVLPGGAGGLGMGTVSLSAPRTGSGWTNIVAHETQRLDLNMSASNDAMFATSAPSGSMHSPALVAAAARTMAAAVQQQQQRQQQQLGLGVQPTLQRSMTATTAAALMAAAKQGSSGLPLLAHAAPGTGLGMRGQLYHRLSPQMRADVQQLLMQFPGLKVEDLDEGVLQQLATRRNEQDALAALRALTGTELTTMHPLAAFTAHGADAGLSGFTTTPLNRTSSVPLASRALLQKLPPRVYARLEEVVSRCSYMDWKHFDAGVVKVMGQLSEISEADVLEELQLLEATDLSNVEYMPAYLNKRLNNRLWSRRKAQQAAQAGLGQH